MNRFLFLFLMVGFCLKADDFINKIVLIEKSEVKEMVKSINNEMCITESGQEIKLSEISEIVFKEKSNKGGTPPFLLTFNDGLLYAKNIRIIDGLVKFNSEEEDCEINIKSLKSIVFKAVINDQNKLWKDIYNQTFRKLDTLFVLKDNKLVTVEGVIKEIDTEKIKLSWDDSLKTISIDKIAGIIFASNNIALESNFELVLIDGSKLFCSKILLEEGQLKFGLIINEVNHQLPLKLVHKINVINTRIVYLSDLTPIESYSDSILLPSSENWRKNLSMNKKPLMIESKSYNKGFGVHALNRLKFKVSQDSAIFVTDYGIDNEFNNSVGCIFKISLDGKIILQQLVKGGELSRTFTYDLPKGSQEITLIVEPGPGLDIGDYGVWGNTRFLKNK